MQLQYMAGDRTAALRQYERCVVALDEDLGVKPDKRTVELYEKIRSGEPEHHSPLAELLSASTVPTASMLANVLGRLEDLELTLVNMRQNVRQDIKDIEQLMNSKKGESRASSSSG